MSLRIGLTGGIGSGKSTVAGLWQALGAGLVDTDAISRRLTAPGGRAMPAIVQAFGPAAMQADGALDRTHMRQRAFHDEAVRRQLEAILHPLISAETERDAAAHANSPWIVFDVPLLVESGRWRQRVDRVLVVDCEEPTQVARVMARSHWTEDTVLAVMRQQASRAQRRAAADAVIYNENLSLPALGEDVLRLSEAWR